MTDYTALIVQIDGPVARITLNRPDTRNAFDETVIDELTHAFQQAGAASAVCAIVLGANGPAFCAGANLNWMRRAADFTRAQNVQDAGDLAAMLRAIHDCPKPVIARVQGDTYAGGMGLVAVCDIAVAAEGAGFCLSEVKIGLIPATISPYVLRAMGERAARRYFLTGERFSAAEALRIGLVHEVVAPDALDARIDAILKPLLAAGPAAVCACKQLVSEVAGRTIDDALIARTVEAIADIRASAEGREGIRAFLEKRKPDWRAPA